MDQQLVPAVEAEHHDFEEAAGGVESEAQLSSWTVVVQVAHEDGMMSGMDGITRIDSVLQCGVVDVHAT